MKEVQLLSLTPGQQLQQLIEGPRRSKLTFAASEECSAPIRLDRLRRVREPVSRSKSGVQGIQYAKVLVPWYKGKLERFQGTMCHDLMHGNPGTTFSNILERDDYDPSRHAVVLLSTFREMLHRWIIDVYLQTPHRGIKDTPAHRWHSETIGLPPPLPPSAGELDVVLGMIVHRVVFHYGIEL